jgi:tetratricopeptide (TPR) repeat protein
MAHRPSPYTIAVAALIALHCQEDSPLYQDEVTDFTLVDSFLSDVLLQQNTSSSANHWASLHGPRVQSLFRQLEAAISSGVSMSIAEQFKGWLMIGTSSIDALTDLMTTIQRAVSDGSVDSTSAHGVFLRSCILGYDELSFESVVELWREFHEEVRDEESDSYQQQWMLSSHQVESAILNQCWNSSSLVEGADLEEMQDQLRHVLALNPELPSAYLLRFILCLQSGERVGAMDALHQYMDYALSAESGGEDILQFAAILLAVLHDQFGEGQLVAVATEEAVRVAQQSQDAAAVAFALGWLAVYAKNDEKQLSLLQRCVQRAGTLRPLLAGANLSLAALTHSWIPLAQVVEDPAITGTESMGMIGDRPTHASFLDERFSGTTAAVAAARQKLVAANLFGRFGEGTLSAQSSLSALYCHKDRLSSSDIAVAAHNLGSGAAYGSSAMVNSNAPVRWLASDLSSTDCIYGNAIRIFVCLREANRLQLDGTFQFDVALVMHEWAIRRGDLDHAEALMMVMESQLHPRIDNCNQIVFEMYAQKALLLSRQGRFEEAKLFLEETMKKYESKSARGLKAQLLLQYAMVHLESHPTHFMNSLHPVLECLTLTKELKMDGLEDAALSILAQVHLRKGQCTRAIHVLQSTLPRLLQHGHVWLQAEAYLTLAKCRIRQTSEGMVSSPEQINMLRTAVLDLQRSASLFSKCHDCTRLREVYYLLARTYDALPNAKNLRDRAAKGFISAGMSRKPSLSTADVVDSLSSRTGILKLTERRCPVVVESI